MFAPQLSITSSLASNPEEADSKNKTVSLTLMRSNKSRTLSKAGVTKENRCLNRGMLKLKKNVKSVKEYFS